MNQYQSELQRYAVITEKNPREIVLLRGTGCRYLRCSFCDYHLDCSKDEEANDALNRDVLAQVDGRFGKLEVINSGSFPELGEATLAEVARVCRDKGIRTVWFECHWLYRNAVPALRTRFAEDGIDVKIKTGVESFDPEYREQFLRKGILLHGKPVEDPALIAEPFDECCLLQGLPGQTEESMRRDIETGLQYFERVCVNIMTPNQSEVAPDPDVIRVFRERVYPEYIANQRVDILMENTDFGVGATGGTT